MSFGSVITHQNSVEVRPVKKRSDSVERSKRKESKSGSGMNDLPNLNFDFMPEVLLKTDHVDGMMNRKLHGEDQ